MLNSVSTRFNRLMRGALPAVVLVAAELLHPYLGLAQDPPGSDKVAEFTSELIHPDGKIKKGTVEQYLRAVNQVISRVQPQGISRAQIDAINQKLAANPMKIKMPYPRAGVDKLGNPVAPTGQSAKNTPVVLAIAKLYTVDPATPGLPGTGGISGRPGMYEHAHAGWFTTEKLTLWEPLPQTEQQAAFPKQGRAVTYNTGEILPSGNAAKPHNRLDIHLRSNIIGPEGHAPSAKGVALGWAPFFISALYVEGRRDLDTRLGVEPDPELYDFEALLATLYASQEGMLWGQTGRTMTLTMVSHGGRLFLMAAPAIPTAAAVGTTYALAAVNYYLMKEIMVNDNKTPNRWLHKYRLPADSRGNPNNLPHSAIACHHRWAEDRLDESRFRNLSAEYEKIKQDLIVASPWNFLNPGELGNPTDPRPTITAEFLEDDTLNPDFGLPDAEKWLNQHFVGVIGMDKATEPLLIEPPDLSELPIFEEWGAAKRLEHGIAPETPCNDCHQASAIGSPLYVSPNHEDQGKDEKRHEQCFGCHTPIQKDVANDVTWTCRKTHRNKKLTVGFSPVNPQGGEVTGEVTHDKKVYIGTAGQKRNGEIRCGGGNLDCVEEVFTGETVELSAKARDGYQFSNWTGTNCQCHPDFPTCKLNHAEIGLYDNSNVIPKCENDSLCQANFKLAAPPSPTSAPVPATTVDPHVAKVIIMPSESEGTVTGKLSSDHYGAFPPSPYLSKDWKNGGTSGGINCLDSSGKEDCIESLSAENQTLILEAKAKSGARFRKWSAGAGFECLCKSPDPNAELPAQHTCELTYKQVKPLGGLAQNIFVTLCSAHFVKVPAITVNLASLDEGSKSRLIQSDILTEPNNVTDLLTTTATLPNGVKKVCRFTRKINEFRQEIIGYEGDCSFTLNYWESASISLETGYFRDLTDEGVFLGWRTKSPQESLEPCPVCMGQGKQCSFQYDNSLLDRKYNLDCAPVFKYVK